jgi:drug/metabolite transporter (DMT)-like permease
MHVLDIELPQRRKNYLFALGQMFVVTVLWASSFPIHKILLDGGVPPLSLAAYRYFLAAVILVAAVGVRNRNHSGSGENGNSPADKRSVGFPILLTIGICMYGAQGVHMAALSMLTASDSGLVSMTWMPIAVVLLALLLDGRLPRRAQLIGLFIILFGLYSYFPSKLAGARLLGIGLNVLSSSMWAVAVIFSHRAVNRMHISSLKLTTVTMLSGSFILLIAAVLHDHVYVPAPWQGAWLVYLALINTAFGFALYNHTMKSLGAFEIAVFQDSMIVQIGILSAIFLGESITPAMAMGMVLVSLGIAVVQIFAPRMNMPAPSQEGRTAGAPLETE